MSLSTKCCTWLDKPRRLRDRNPSLTVRGCREYRYMPKGIRYAINPSCAEAHIEPFTAYRAHSAYRKSRQGFISMRCNAALRGALGTENPSPTTFCLTRQHFQTLKQSRVVTKAVTTQAYILADLIGFYLAFYGFIPTFLERF